MSATTDPKLTDDVHGLELLADVPAPRRTDAAFARSVAEGVQAKKRSRTFFIMPALVATTAALALVAVVRPAPLDVGTDAGVVLLARADDGAELPFDDADAPFAIPSFDGSSDEELARLDQALDAALAAHGVRPQ